MAESTIKDFVKKQTSSLNIGVPKVKPATIAPLDEIGEAPAAYQTVASANETPAPTVKTTGRPKSEIQKVKLSLYVPEETKTKLVRIQHLSFKSSLNDVLLEAINEYLEKHKDQ